MWPAARGFERDLSVLDGGGSHWADMQGLLPAHPKLTVTRNGARVGQLPEGYYSTKNATDFISGCIDDRDTPRIATSGAFTIGVNAVPPIPPRLDIVKLAPCSCGALSLPSRASAESSPSSLAIS